MDSSRDADFTGSIFHESTSRMGDYTLMWIGFRLSRRYALEPSAKPDGVREDPLADRLWEDVDMIPAEFAEHWGR